MKSQAKRIVLGVTGSVAAYKAAELLRLLVKAGHDVRVVQTPSSLNFIGETTFRALSGNAVFSDQFSPDGETALAHIDLADSDLLVIAPATANTIGKMAAGIADNLLLSLYLAARCPVVVCPAMNSGMWSHPAVRANMEKLFERDVTIVSPEKGALACGTEGEGRLAEPEKISAVVDQIVNKQDEVGILSADGRGDFTGRRILITAGATREPIDTVRFVSNRSSGRMGTALAEAARERGAEVTVVAANLSVSEIPQVRYLQVSTNDELTEVLHREFAEHDILIMAAAVADYGVSSAEATGKLEREGKNDLQLTPTSDIVRSLGVAGSRRLKVGFAAEYGSDKLERARCKLKDKNLDIIVFNDISRADIGFESDDNEIVIMATGQEDLFVDKTSKKECAHRILDQIKILQP